MKMVQRMGLATALVGMFCILRDKIDGQELSLIMCGLTVFGFLLFIGLKMEDDD